MMKKKLIFILLIINGLSLSSQEVVDAIIAIIGKEIVLKSDLEKRYLEMNSRYLVVDNIEEEKCALLENMLYEKLMLHQAALDSLTVSDEQVDYQITARIMQLIQYVGGDQTVLEKHFGKTIFEMKKDMREMMREQILIDQVISKITENVNITPSEVKNFVNRVTLDSMPLIPETYEFGHILKTPPVSEVEIAEIKQRLENYRERILRGEKIGSLAVLYSDDPGSARKGGDLGFVERGVLYPEFEAVAFSLKSGEVSNIVQTKAGYHIIQMIERRGESINVAHILLQPKPSPEEQVKAIEYLDSIRTLIINEKQDFSTAALQYSDDLNKNSGGWVINQYSGSSKFEKEMMDPATATAIAKLIQGEYSSPLPYIDEDGVMSYRIIYLKSKIAAHKANLVEDYDIIKNAALDEKKEAAIHKWMINKVKVTSTKISDQYKNCSFLKEWQIH